MQDGVLGLSELCERVEHQVLLLLEERLGITRLYLTMDDLYRR
jgi:hypothetical protein